MDLMIKMGIVVFLIETITVPSAALCDGEIIKFYGHKAQNTVQKGIL